MPGKRLMILRISAGSSTSCQHPSLFIVNNVTDGRLNPRRNVHSRQRYPGMGGGEDPEDFVREPLAQGFHPRKVQNDLAKPIQPGSTAQQMLPATLRFKRQ